jgi:predicted nucleotidyltransferase
MISDPINLATIRATLHQHLPILEARHGVVSLGVFGSRVRGDERPESDLDVLVTFRRNPGLIRLVTLEDELADLLGVRVDLVLADSLKPHVRNRILAEVVPI